MTYTGKYDPKLGYHPGRSDESRCIVCGTVMGWCGCRLSGYSVASSEFVPPYPVWHLLEQRYIEAATRGWEYV